VKDRNGPKRIREVQRRARQIQQKTGKGYGKAMRIAGWQVRNASNQGKD